jgi:hypothetical protein
MIDNTMTTGTDNDRQILYLYLLILLSFSFNDNGGVMVRLEIVCSSPGRVKPKTMEIVFVAASANYAALLLFHGDNDLLSVK